MRIFLEDEALVFVFPVRDLLIEHLRHLWTREMLLDFFLFMIYDSFSKNGRAGIAPKLSTLFELSIERDTQRAMVWLQWINWGHKQFG